MSIDSKNSPGPVLNVNPEAKLVDEVEEKYSKYVNVLAFISKIADPAVLLADKKDEKKMADRGKCKECNHLCIDHERYQTDAYIHIHYPIQKQQCWEVCFRASLPSRCWQCKECYEDNSLSAKDDLEHDAMPKWAWVWRTSMTIDGTTGHLVYQVPDSTDPSRTRDGYVIPWVRYYCEDHLPKTSAAALKSYKIASRAPIKDLIEESYAETEARADTCNDTIQTVGTKKYNVQNENRDYYGVLLDTTELETIYSSAVLTLFDVRRPPGPTP